MNQAFQEMMQVLADLNPFLPRSYYFCPLSFKYFKCGKQKSSHSSFYFSH